MLDLLQLLYLEFDLRLRKHCVHIAALNPPHISSYCSFYFPWDHRAHSGPSCSKLTMLLVNDSLKFTLSDTQIC